MCCTMTGENSWDSFPSHSFWMEILSPESTASIPLYASSRSASVRLHSGVRQRSVSTRFSHISQTRAPLLVTA